MSLTDGLAGVPWTVCGGVCLVIAAVYLIVWPRPKANASSRGSWRRRILRWGHGAVWLVLAAACFARVAAWAGVSDLANGVALVGGVLYLVFVASFVQDRLEASRL
jgi:hypothetical protein